MRQLVVASLILSISSFAYAHGRPASLQSLRLDPTDPDRLVAQATWGLVLSHDRGATWSWICAAAFDVDARMEDPQVELSPDGTIVLATYDGLYTSDQGCDWAPVASIGDVLVSAVVPDRFAMVSHGAEPDRLYRYVDGEWLAGGSTSEILITHMRLEDQRLFLSGHVPNTATTQRALFSLSTIDGESFEPVEIPSEEGEYTFSLLASEGEELWGVARHFNGEDVPERVLRSIDGGLTWETVLRVPQVGGIVKHQGAIHVGSKLGGVWRSTDSESFDQVESVRARCLASIHDELWICGDSDVDDFALATLDESGLTPILKLEDIIEMEPCETCSDVGIICPGWLPDVVVDLGIDPERVGLSPSELPTGGTGAPREPALPEECGGPPSEEDDDASGCQVSRGPSAPLAALLLWCLLRRRAAI